MLCYVQQVEVLRTLFWICRFARNCSGTLSRAAAQSAQLRMPMRVATTPFCSVVLAGAKLELELAAAVRSKLWSWNWLQPSSPLVVAGIGSGRPAFLCLHVGSVAPPLHNTSGRGCNDRRLLAEAPAIQAPQRTYYYVCIWLGGSGRCVL